MGKEEESKDSVTQPHAFMPRHKVCVFVLFCFLKLGFLKLGFLKLGKKLTELSSRRILCIDMVLEKELDNKCILGCICFSATGRGAAAVYMKDVGFTSHFVYFTSLITHTHMIHTLSAYTHTHA